MAAFAGLTIRREVWEILRRSRCIASARYLTQPSGTEA